jgi:hypothetical protein
MRRFPTITSLPVLLVMVLIPGIGITQERALSEAEPPPFAENWQVIDVFGSVVQIRDYLGKMHYKRQGEELEGVLIKDLDNENNTIVVQNVGDGREKRIGVSDSRLRKPFGTDAPAVARQVRTIMDGEPKGLDTRFSEVGAVSRPVKEILNLLSRSAEVNFITSAKVENVPVTFQMRNITVRQVLDRLLPEYGLAWRESDRGSFIEVLPVEEKKERDRVEWETVECQVLAAPVVVQQLWRSLEQGERIEARDGNEVAILANEERRTILKREVRALEAKTLAWLPSHEEFLEKEYPGLGHMVPHFEVDNRPIKDVLNLLSRFSGLNFVAATDVPDVPVTAKLSNVTVRVILDSLLPAYGLAWEPGPAGIVRVVREANESGGLTIGRRKPGKAAASGPPIPPVPRGEGIPGLDRKVPVLEVKDLPLRDVMRLVGGSAEMDFVIEGDAGDARVDAKLSNLTVREALEALLPANGCRWEPTADGKAIRVFRAE